MIESDFRRDLQKGIEAQGGWAYKIPDLARGQLKPCDLVVGYQRELFLIECKLTKLKRQKPIGIDDTVISMGDFRPHQLPTLKQVETGEQALGCVAVCVVNETQRGWKRAWMLPVGAMFMQPQYTLGELLQPRWKDYELQWAPTVGWQVRWYLWSRGQT